MWKYASTIVIVVVSYLMCAQSVFSYGEDLLAHTGEYTFFITPNPVTCVTYRKRLVPCVVKETIPVAQRYAMTYPIPFPGKQRVPVVVQETPVGCAAGSGPCTTCTPKCFTSSGILYKKTPRIIPVTITGKRYMPQCVTKRVMLPQWYVVEEFPKPPPRKIQPVYKVRPNG